MTQEIEYTIKQLESMLDAASSVGCFEDYNALNASLTLCRAELARQDARPLTCDGCKQQGEWDNELEYGYNCPCIACKRNCVDRYEPKGEKE